MWEWNGGTVLVLICLKLAPFVQKIQLSSDLAHVDICQRGDCGRYNGVIDASGNSNASLWHYVVAMEELKTECIADAMSLENRAEFCQRSIIKGGLVMDVSDFVEIRNRNGAGFDERREELDGAGHGSVVDIDKK